MLEAWLTHTPGLNVVVPSTPTDARALLHSCVRNDDPCVFIEQVPNYAFKGELEDLSVPLGAAAVRRSGGDVTVVTYGRQVHDAVAVAVQLEEEGIGVEVIDLRSLSPLDFPSITSSVHKTRRAVVLHEAVTTGGFGAELATLISEECFGELEAPVLRVGALDVPLPYAKNLERLALPSKSRLAETIRRSVGQTR
jgi:acetoin:2,6-dichlorophenolindophenol oxidoreductase subunit beta